jgi:hypothetical protein
MRMPFRLALAFCCFLALLVDFWLFVAVLLLFGRAFLVQRGREVTSAAVGRGQRELPGEAGEAADSAVSPLDILPFP